MSLWGPIGLEVQWSLRHCTPKHCALEPAPLLQVLPLGMYSSCLFFFFLSVRFAVLTGCASRIGDFPLGLCWCGARWVCPPSTAKTRVDVCPASRARSNWQNATPTCSWHMLYARLWPPSCLFFCVHLLPGPVQLVALPISRRMDCLIDFLSFMFRGIQPSVSMGSIELEVQQFLRHCEPNATLLNRADSTVATASARYVLLLLFCSLYVLLHQLKCASRIGSFSLGLCWCDVQRVCGPSRAKTRANVCLVSRARSSRRSAMPACSYSWHMLYARLWPPSLLFFVSICCPGPCNL